MAAHQPDAQRRLRRCCRRRLLERRHRHRFVGHLQVDRDHLLRQLLRRNEPVELELLEARRRGRRSSRRRDVDERAEGERPPARRVLLHLWPRELRRRRVVTHVGDGTRQVVGGSSAAWARGHGSQPSHTPRGSDATQTCPRRLGQGARGAVPTAVDFAERDRTSRTSSGSGVALSRALRRRPMERAGRPLGQQRDVLRRAAGREDRRDQQLTASARRHGARRRPPRRRAPDPRSRASARSRRSAAAAPGRAAPRRRGRYRASP